MRKFDECYEYLEKMGVTTKVLYNRVRFLYDVASKMCPEEIEQIFIEDSIKKDNTREYGSLWFFSKGFILEAHNFEIEYEIDIMANKIIRVELELNNYNLKKAEEGSRLRVYMHLSEDITGELKAAKENCDVLMDIASKYIMPKLNRLT